MGINHYLVLLLLLEYQAKVQMQELNQTQHYTKASAHMLQTIPRLSAKFLINNAQKTKMKSKLTIREVLFHFSQAIKVENTTNYKVWEKIEMQEMDMPLIYIQTKYKQADIQYTEKMKGVKIQDNLDHQAKIKLNRKQRSMN